VTFSPILNGSQAPLGISAISRDITQLVAARTELADREERIRLLLDSTAEAIYGIDLNGVCIFCNAACARLLGYDSPAALIGKHMHPLIHHTRVDGSPYPPEQSSIFDTMRHREEAHVDDEVLWRADGTAFPAAYWSHPIVRGDELIGAVVTFLDITERKQSEAEILEGVRRREQFLSMLSHELRNPLAAILSATRLLDAAGWQDGSCMEAGHVVERQAKHMTRLLDDLLDVSRITRGKITLTRETVELATLVTRALETTQPLIQERDRELILDIPSEPLRINGDATRLTQALGNVLGNAAKYTDRGGRIELRCCREAADVEIRVRDNGIGIPAELLPRIFDLFTQLDRRSDPSPSGLGIGLALVRRLVEMHGGSIMAQSAGAGSGSEFVIRLPLLTGVGARPEHHAEPPGDRDEPTVPRRILLADDNADALESLATVLRLHGHEVYCAPNGAIALETAVRHMPEVALLDIGMPMLDGYEVARRIRAQQWGNAVTLVALTGWGQESDRRRSQEAGFDTHLVKPLDLEKLTALLAHLPTQGSAPGPPEMPLQYAGRQV
jgi:PAS domain S-box-containing protein